MTTQNSSFNYCPLISVILPVYNIDESWLRATLNSVKKQLYTNWELCIADDGSDKKSVRETIELYRKSDDRIRVKYLSRNQGIAAATNEALTLASGEFAGFLDHDDELAPDALWEVVKLLNSNPALDMIYSDSDKISQDGHYIHPHHKPSYSPELLLTQNYISHFCLIRRSLLKTLGGLRRGFDGSQDYELLLRVVEKTNRIGHIPKVLYHWRIVPGSVAGDLYAKPYAYKAAQRALTEALARRGIKGYVQIVSPGNYRVCPTENCFVKLGKEMAAPISSFVGSFIKK